METHLLCISCTHHACSICKRVKAPGLSTIKVRYKSHWRLGVAVDKQQVTALAGAPSLSDTLVKRLMCSFLFLPFSSPPCSYAHCLYCCLWWGLLTPSSAVFLVPEGIKNRGWWTEYCVQERLIILTALYYMLQWFPIHTQTQTMYSQPHFHISGHIYSNTHIIPVVGTAHTHTHMYTPLYLKTFKYCWACFLWVPHYSPCHTVVSLTLSMPSLFQYLAPPLISHPSCFHSFPLHFISLFYHLHHISVISSQGESWIVILLALPSWKQWHKSALVFIVRFLHLVLHQICFWFSISGQRTTSSGVSTACACATIAGALRCCCYNNWVALLAIKAETIQTPWKKWSDIENLHINPWKKGNPCTRSPLQPRKKP